MRDYGKIVSGFWIGETAKEFRGFPETQVLAAYMITGPHANWIGLYYLPMIYMEHETGISREGLLKALRRLGEAGFCHHDAGSEVVFVPRMAAIQIAESLKASDNRCAGIQKDYDSIPANPFLEKFYELYAKPFHLSKKRRNGVNGKAKLEDPLKGLRSQEPSRARNEQDADPLSLPPPPERETEPQISTVAGGDPGGGADAGDYRPPPISSIIPPPMDALIAHGNRIMLARGDCEDFYAFYKSKGWVVGNHPMADWQAALERWKKRRPEFVPRHAGSFRPPPKPIDTSAEAIAAASASRRAQIERTNAIAAKEAEERMRKNG